MSVAAATDPGRVRTENQDRHIAKRAHGITLIAVADGVGGEAGGDIAARAAVDALAAAPLRRSDDPAAALSSAVRAANDAVLQAATESGHATASSTLVAARISGSRCAIANLGDSRAYLVRDREAQQITTDHTGTLAHSITRFVGDPRGVAPDVFTETLRRGDRVVLCSDGLTLHVAGDEIARTVSTERPDRAAAHLVALANSRGGQDNVTVVVYEAEAFPRKVAWAAAAFVAAAAVLIAALYAFAPSAGPAPSVPGSPAPSATISPTASPTVTPSATP